MKKSEIINMSFLLLLVIAISGCKNKSAKTSAIDDIAAYDIDTIESKQAETVSMPDQAECVMGWMKGADASEYEAVNLILTAYDEKAIPSSIVPEVMPLIKKVSKAHCKQDVDDLASLHKVLTFIASDAYKRSKNAEDKKTALLFCDASQYFSACYARYCIDDVLRHYPELYHAADIVEKSYNKWVERENSMIDMAFVGKGAKRTNLANFKYALLTARFQNLNAIEQLCQILNDKYKPTGKETTLTDDDFTNVYRMILSKVKDHTGNGNFSANEIKSSIEKARKGWLEYAGSLPGLVEAMPKDDRLMMADAVNRIMRLHLIDMKNMYMSYWNDVKPAWLLQDNATAEDARKSEIQAYHYCEWME